MGHDITPEDLHARLKANSKINFFDVREQWEYEESNLGAVNIPLGDLPNRLNEIYHLKDDEIIVHCKSGSRGNQARKFLLTKGFLKIRNLNGGI
jgi:rhodanese-related sulfurtransferase